VRCEQALVAQPRHWSISLWNCGVKKSERRIAIGLHESGPANLLNPFSRKRRKRGRRISRWTTQADFVPANNDDQKRRGPSSEPGVPNPAQVTKRGLCGGLQNRYFKRIRAVANVQRAWRKPPRVRDIQRSAWQFMQEFRLQVLLGNGRRGIAILSFWNTSIVHRLHGSQNPAPLQVLHEAQNLIDGKVRLHVVDAFSKLLGRQLFGFGSCLAIGINDRARQL
jgi:hypothetical protein